MDIARQLGEGRAELDPLPSKCRDFSHPVHDSVVLIRGVTFRPAPSHPPQWVRLRASPRGVVLLASRDRRPEVRALTSRAPLPGLSPASEALKSESRNAEYPCCSGSKTTIRRFR
jgi:hypothetical protein